jgi:predicted metal-dependent enzyme (double-stranded beta helix superfamily)
MTFTLNTANPDVLTPEMALQEAIPVLSRLVDDHDFLDSHVLLHLEEAVRAEDWYVAYRRDDPDHPYSLQVFVWPPGTATMIHDHSSWGAFCCVVGSVVEERYERADDGSVSLPYERGIHRVGNPTEAPAISVHRYGPRLGEIDGRDYDPSQNYVCDRLEDR